MTTVPAPTTPAAPSTPIRRVVLDVPDHGPVHALDLGGSGDDVVLLVHGLDGSAANWIDVAPLLTDRHRVLAIDLPGFGRTPLDDRSLRMEDLGALTAAVARGLGRCVLVGNSMGGPVVLAAAAALGTACAGVALVAPALPRAGRGPVAWSFLPQALALQLPGVAAGTPAARQAQSPDVRVRGLLDLCYAPGTRQESPEAFAEMVAVAQARTRADATAAWPAAAKDLWTLLARRSRFHRIASQVTAPVVVVDGLRDPIIPTASVVATLARHPTWTRTPLDVGHVPQLEDPTGTAAAILALAAH